MYKAKFPIAIFVSALVLTTATAVSFGSAADSTTMKATSKTSMQTSSTMPNDSNSISGRVKEQLKAYQDVKVAMNNGEAKLSGIVNSSAEKEAVIQRVREVPGVTSVKDELKIKGEDTGTIEAYVDDASITGVVKGKLLAQKGLDSLDISVETTDGVVTLSGKVDNTEQIKLAEMVAKEAEGVSAVENRLTAK